MVIILVHKFLTLNLNQEFLIIFRVILSIIEKFPPEKFRYMLIDVAFGRWACKYCPINVWKLDFAP